MKDSITNPFKITIESHGIKVTYELPHSGIDTDDLRHALRGVLLASGWCNATVTEILGNY